MTYKAEVLRVRGACTHLTATRDVTHDARRIVIQREEGMLYLLRYDEHGVCIADTAHATLAEARRQAECEYELSWESAPPRQTGG